MIVELLITVYDHADTENHKRSKLGDIITVKPYGNKWGKKELDSYFVIPIETNMDYEQVELRLKSRYNDEKRRFSIDIKDLKKIYKPLGEHKFKNKECKYQPLVKQSRFDYFTGENGKHNINKHDFDCGEKSTEEIVIPLGTKLIYDKSTDTKISLDELPEYIHIPIEDE